MKKGENHNFKLLSKIITGMQLAISMTTFLCLCNGNADLEEDCNKVADSHERLQDSLQNALDADKTESSSIRRNANDFLEKLSDFKSLSAAKDKKIQIVIRDMQKAAREIIA